MYALLVRLVPVADCIVRGLDAWAAPVADLLIRVALFGVFFGAGLAKVADWNGTLTLFAHDYAVPVLPAATAATMAAFDELVAATLLLVGLGARLAALPLLAQALVIQFSLGPAYNTLEHWLWIVLLLTVIARGPGLLSLDHMVRRRLLPDSPL